MTPVEIVRMKTGDKSTLKRERGLPGTGAQLIYPLEMQNIVSSPAPRVYVDNVLKTLTTDYTLDLVNGTLVFLVAPVLGADITVEYYFGVYSDIEVTQFLTEAGNNTDYAAAKNLLAWAANKSRIAMRETLSGGGGVGTTTRDTSVVAQELRATANALMDIYKTDRTGDNYQSEGLTEVVWNEQMANRAMDQELIRNW